jgi:polysaccharide pyruvyl transferase WcaK-like protein
MAAINKHLNAPKIGLLTPYTGGNLGDGAIQEAVIANIRARYPCARIHGFTLNPEATTKLHGIPCSALTALPVPYYFLPKSEISSAGSIPNPNSSRAIRSAKDFVKRISPLYRILRFVRGIALVAAYLPSEYRFIRNIRDQLKAFDLLIVSGGGQLDDYWGGPWGHPYTLFKFALAARAAGIRYMFMSVGACSLESPLTVLFLKTALRLAAYRSYRDAQSKALLNRMNFTVQDSVIPDLAFSYSIPRQLLTPTTPTSNNVVGISPIAYLAPHSWPESNLPTHSHYIATLIDFVSFLVQHGYRPVLYNTDATDKPVLQQMMDIFAKSKTSNSIVRARLVKTTDELISLMSEVDFVVASRLHGVILAHVMHKPVLAISYDKKVTTHMRDQDQCENCLDIHNITLDPLINSFLALKLNKEAVVTTIARKMAEYRRVLTDQYDKVLNLYGNPTPAPAPESNVRI